MRTVVLDSEALSRLARAHQGQTPGVVHAWIRAAANESASVVVPAAVLAEQYRGGRYDSAVDSCLARYPGIEVKDTTRPLARTIGGILARAGQGSAHHVDATVVAVATTSPESSVILTSDPDDMTVLVAGDPTIAVITVSSN